MITQTVSRNHGHSCLPILADRGRYNGKRFDPSSGNYDMGFRDYSPGLNRFMTRDMYNGALADLTMAADPWTGNRYAFTGGNPITWIELDGHCWDLLQWACDAANAVWEGTKWTVNQIADGITEVVKGVKAVVEGLASTVGSVANCGGSLVGLGDSGPRKGGRPPST